MGSNFGPLILGNSHIAMFACCTMILGIVGTALSYSRSCPGPAWLHGWRREAMPGRTALARGLQKTVSVASTTICVVGPLELLYRLIV